MEGTVPLADGRRFRVKETGKDAWAIEYLEAKEVGDVVHWNVSAVKPVHDKAVWVLWNLFLESIAPRE